MRALMQGVVARRSREYRGKESCEVESLKLNGNRYFVLEVWSRFGFAFETSRSFVWSERAVEFEMRGLHCSRWGRSRSLAGESKSQTMEAPPRIAPMGPCLRIGRLRKRSIAFLEGSLAQYQTLSHPDLARFLPSSFLSSVSHPIPPFLPSRTLKPHGDRLR